MKNIWRMTPVLFIPFIFLAVGIATLSHYGINWDEPFHFAKGHAALHYMLTRNKDFLDLPAYSPKPKGSSDFMDQFGAESKIYLDAPKSREDPTSNARRSYYQSDVWTYEYLTANKIVGHPEVNDLLAALTNFVFYQKLGVMGDIESHHLFELIASFLIILSVALLVNYHFGVGPSIVAAFTLSTYPIFFAESHFNVKDPPLAAFFGLTIITFYFGMVKRNWKLIFLSSAFFALAFGTKFNAFFVAPIVILWLIFYLFIERRRKKLPRLLINRGLIIALFLFPLFSGVLFFVLSPTFWPDAIGRLVTIIDYYRQIGAGTPPELSSYLIKGWNTYPFVWFIVATPVPILVLTLIGILVSLYTLVKKADHFSLLVLLWFFTPFLRVTIPNTNIYGGIRQIVEFAPAMAILTGVGADALFRLKNYSRFLKLAVVASLVFVLWEVFSIHPNENVYFNQLIGGLSGAREKDIPYWGNSYGNVYLQGVKWLNVNAEENAKLALPINTSYHIPRTKLRPDIDFSNAYLSGDTHEGEYVMEHYFDWDPQSWFRYAYYETYLEPIYEVKVDGVALLKIWKNSPEYLREGYDKESLYRPKRTSVDMVEVASNVKYKKITIDLGQEVFVTKLTLQHSSVDCEKQPTGFGYVALSDDGEVWKKEPEDITIPQARLNKDEYDDDTFTFLFAAKPARYVLVDTQMENSCYLKYPSAQVRGLSNLP